MVYAARRGSAGRAVFWVLALAVIGGLGYFIWVKKQPPVSQNKPVGKEVAAYLAREHMQAWDPSMDAVFTVKNVEDIHAAGVRWFGQDITFEELAGSGVAFMGAGEAAVPGPPDENLKRGQSAHFRLETDGTKGAKGVRVSLFLQKYTLPPNDDNTEVLAKRTSYTLKPDAALGANAPPILVYRAGGLVYFLVTETPGGYDLVKQAFGMPDPIGPY